MKSIMRKTMVAGTALAGSLLVMPLQAALVFDYSNTTGSKIHFKGGSVDDPDARYFDFLPGGNQFSVTASSGGVGSASGLSGDFGTTKYRVGDINYGVASVLDSGIMTIHDGASHDLTATVHWTEIGTMGIAGTLNINGLVNLSSISYFGNNSDLLAFKNGTDQKVVLSFGFSTYQPTPLLTHLMAAGQDHTTAFAGQMSALQQMSAVPEGSTWVAGFGMLWMLLLVGSGAHSRIRGVFRLGANNC